MDMQSRMAATPRNVKTAIDVRRDDLNENQNDEENIEPNWR